MYQTIIPVANIEETKLRSLVEDLSQASGQKIELEARYILSTPDPKVSSMLDCLASVVKNHGQGKTPVSDEEKPVKHAGGRPKKNGSAKVHRVGKRSVSLTDGRVISLQAFNKGLKKGEYPPGTIVQSSLHGRGNVSEDGKTILWGLPS